MKELEILIDKSLHNEASEDDKKRLSQLMNESDEAFEFYLQSVQQQSDLKEWAEQQVSQSKLNSQTKTIKFPFYRSILALAALLIAGFFFLIPTLDQPSLELNIHSVSTNYKLIRNGEMLSGEELVQKGDQILVGAGGQVRIDVADQDSQIYLMENSSVNFVNRDCNKINLQQGEIRAKLEKQKVPFIIKTNEGEAEIIGTEFSLTDKGDTQLWVSSGKVKLKRGEKDSVLVGAGHRIDTESFQLESKSGSQLIPKLYQGVEYLYYHNPQISLTLDNDMHLIDQGIRSDFDYLTGAYDGYVRAAAVKYSFVNTKPFLMVLKAYFESAESVTKTIRVKSLRPASLRVNEKLYKLDPQSEAIIDFQKGHNLIELRTLGGKEADTGEVLVELKEKMADGTFVSLPAKQFFYSSTEGLPDLSESELAAALTCNLPLRNDFIDRVSETKVEVFGSPTFGEDKQMGPVLEMNGKSDYLSHLKADDLGLNGAYTVSCRIYFDQLRSQGRFDDPIFSTRRPSPVEMNSTLVLLIRRKHPYLAHFSNDSIASAVLEEKRWYDITFRFHENTQAIFLDGELLMSSSNHSNLYSSQALLIGKWGENYLKGRICDVKIYNKALSSANIWKLSQF